MKKVVTIGGGSGSYALLKGLKQYPHDLTAVVTMFDSGGSSGVLRDEHGVLPPGDVRRCLVALSEGEREEVLRKLFSFRFENGDSLRGHSFGNILLTALTEILGNEVDAVKHASALLNIKGEVCPVSVKKSHICVELEDGTKIEGETNIDIPKHDGSLRIVDAYLQPSATLHDDAKKAIEDADVIIIGPGDLYTSLIANLLVDGFKEAMQSSKAKKVYILNAMTKWGETHKYKASDFAQEVLKYSGLSAFDTVVYNDDVLGVDVEKKYADAKQERVIVDDELDTLTGQKVYAPLYPNGELVRYDSDRLAEVIDSIIKN